MKINNQLKLAAAVAAGMVLVGCGSDDKATSTSINPDKLFNCEAVTTSPRTICIGSADELTSAKVQSDLINALATSQTGDTFVFPQGRYSLSTTISFQGQNEDTVAVSDLTFKGAGMDLTIFDVSTSSADGFKIEDTDNITFEDFGVYESNNNAIKVIGSDGVIMRRIATVWETDYQETNGAYGLYPVESSNILIEDCFVKGSADAGVYVGQSENIVVRRNTAVKNVAGIEIENSKYADVYDNVARGNTGGILVFDLPIGNGVYGSDVRVFNNIVDANNAPNFAAGCSDEQIASDSCFEGGVHIVPPGTGMIVLSTNNVEIYENTITDNQTAGIAITSYMMADSAVASVPNDNVGTDVLKYSDIAKFADKYLDGWSPFVNGISMHDNTFSVAEGINAPEGKLIQTLIDGYKQFQSSLGIISATENAKLPTILYDGIGELLTKTAYTDFTGEAVPAGLSAALADDGLAVPADASVMYVIAAGIDGIAIGMRGAGLEASSMTATAPFYGPVINTFTGTAATYPDFDGSKYDTDTTSVCQSNNGVNGVTVTAASVFHTTPSAANFNGAEPLAKVEIGGAAALSGDIATAFTQLNAMLDDDSMTCTTPYVGAAAVVTIDGTAYGCGEDDTTSEFCAP